jgi:hypothetical protein
MVMLGSVALGQGAPCIEAFTSARGVARTIFNIIDRVGNVNMQPVYVTGDNIIIVLIQESTIDASSTTGMKPEVVGDVEFRGIDFVYPSRPTVQVMMMAKYLT